jgi:hypothetical protein
LAYQQTFMYLSPPHPREPFFGGRSARSAADLGQGAAALVAVVPPRPAWAAYTAGALARGTRLVLNHLRLVALIWAFIPAQAQAAGSVAVPARPTSSSGDVHRATANHPVHSPPAHARTNRVSKLRSGKHHVVPYVIVHPDSPNGDDTTSNDRDDDDDDDTSHDLNSDGDSEQGILDFLCETVLWMIGHDADISPAWTLNFSSSFPARQRLRC